MASYEKDKKSKTWNVRFWTFENGKIVHKRHRGHRTKEDAETWYSKVLLKQEGAELGVNMTLNQMAKLYAEHAEQRLKRNSVTSIKDILRLYILPYFGAKRVDKITTFDIKTWQDEINKKGHSFKYKQKMQGHFSGLLNFAARYYGLQSNVVRLCGSFTNTEPRREMQFWTEEEFYSFIQFVDDPLYKTFFLFLYLTGCRRGEALTLTWEDVNLFNRIARIRKTINRKGMKGSGQTYEITTPKNSPSNRDILLPDNLISVLREWYNICAEYAGFDNKAFIFGIAHPLHENTAARKFKEYIRIAGAKEIRLHDLRHSHASLLINKGQNILIVSKRLGHSNIERTLNTYSHLFPNIQEQIIDAINNPAFSSLKPSVIKLKEQ